MTRKILLICGIVSSLLYVAMNVFVPMQWAGYSSASQTVSELSAIGAPTRPLWIPFGVAYTLLVAAFGWGLWTSARQHRPLRVAGGFVVLMLFAMGFGAAAFENRFRLYSIATMVVLLACGTL